MVSVRELGFASAVAVGAVRVVENDFAFGVVLRDIVCAAAAFGVRALGFFVAVVLAAALRVPAFLRGAAFFRVAVFFAATFFFATTFLLAEVFFAVAFFAVAFFAATFFFETAFLAVGAFFFAATFFFETAFFFAAAFFFGAVVARAVNVVISTRRPARGRGHPGDARAGRRFEHPSYPARIVRRGQGPRVVGPREDAPFPADGPRSAAPSPQR
jgi:hypothetical protein